MATPGKAVKKDKKKPIPVKVSLNTPYDLRWAPLEKGHARFIVKTVTGKIDSLGLRKNNVRVFRKWGKKKLEPTPESIPMNTDEPTRDESTRPTTPDLKLAESVQFVAPDSEPTPIQRGWSVKEFRKELAIGINEVTKGLERNELSLVLVCDSVRPAHVTAHLIPLSKTRSVPACQVPGLSSSIGPSLGLSSVLALGFKRTADTFSETVTTLVPKMPPVGVAWGPKRTPGPEQSEESGLRKLQLSPESEEPNAELQPLRVKKIIPNPSKIRKVKKKMIKRV